MRHLDPADSRPLYVQIAASIRDAIAEGEYGIGDTIPGRPKLAAHFGVAQMTAQGALYLLRDEGTVVIRQGLGVFVAQAPERPRDLAAEIDALRARVEALEQSSRTVNSDLT